MDWRRHGRGVVGDERVAPSTRWLQDAGHHADDHADVAAGEVTAGVGASNSVMHIIGAVLLPPSTVATLEAHAQTNVVELAAATARTS